MVTVLVMGASRGIGLEVVRAALGQGYGVRAFARHASAIALTHDRLEKCPGDALVPADVERALVGVDAVVQVLGIPNRDLFGPVDLFSRATAVLLPLMARHGVRRLVAVTGFGAGDSAAAVGPFQRLPFRMLFGRAYDDKTRQEERIIASGLDWTIWRPGVLINGRASGRARILTAPSQWRNGIVSRADVAANMVSHLEDAAMLHQKPVIIRF
ncbi:NAD(P)-dependent oxidoreductase [Novacetimonas pomaceti]|uniref:Epimerase n=1 Tax=Novacetimonas pomaceti TaxID=2021998 RepID=A0A318QAL4_9PROT|nr:SDR family NAD(P)-dependent oxidoreductase [Novacetimonas pomaceti]PYD75660.1 epimerase [Novacetimonas pomaceti]